MFHPSIFDNLLVPQKGPTLIFIYVHKDFKFFCDHSYFSICHVRISWLKFLADSSYHLSHVFPLLSPASSVCPVLVFTFCRMGQEWTINFFSGFSNNFAFLLVLSVLVRMTSFATVLKLLFKLSQNGSIPEFFILGFVLFINLAANIKLKCWWCSLSLSLSILCLKPVQFLPVQKNIICYCKVL